MGDGVVSKVAGYGLEWSGVESCSINVVSGYYLCLFFFHCREEEIFFLFRVLNVGSGRGGREWMAVNFDGIWEI